MTHGEGHSIFNRPVSTWHEAPKKLHKSSKFLKLKGDASNSIKKKATVLRLYHIIR